MPRTRTHGRYDNFDSYGTHDGSHTCTTSAHTPDPAGDPGPAQRDLHAHATHDALKDIQRLLALGGGRIQPALAVPAPLDYTGDTPIEGAGAVARWVALYAQARDLRAALRSGDPVGARQVQRAVRSLFLYEHQLTAKARRRARTILWQHDQCAPLPTFAERVRWARCRCHRCQPALWNMTTAQHPALMQTA